MQVRVPWTQAWLCTKDFRQKCTGAGVAGKVAVPSNAAQRALSGRGAVAPEQEGPASHMALEGEVTESEATSGTEGEGSSTIGAGAYTSDSDSSSDGSSLAVTGISVPPHQQVQPPPPHQHRPPNSPSACVPCPLTQEGGHLLRPRHLRPCPSQPCCPQ
ncbi:hypothetical protein NDU88_009667 [Pleurodeles waltl]|uniref:Uncharacterized protein n=1 Tax=Pleurodeles waltl TaxID=8319 RepID=A0AAV7QXZ2_PLEWA|nr:hypothetical protein NDU88_009667 [Pleurodeles waltl]